MSAPEFEPYRYADEYRERALAMIEKKVEGQEIKAVAPLARPHRANNRHLCGVKEELGGSEAATSGSRRQEKTQGVNKRH